MALTNDVTRDKAKLTKKMAQCGAYIRQIVKEQQKISGVCEKRIRDVNKEMTALRFRLKPYVDDGRDYDDTYYDLKEQYEADVKERAVLERARLLAEETIAQAQLNTYPGERYEGPVV